MTDVVLQTALARLAPPVDGEPKWDDVIRRAGMSPRVRWKLAAVIAAMLLATGVVAGAFAEGVLSGSLDRLSSWVGDEPGERAPEQQAAFDEENAASYAHFPSGTRVGRLLRFDFHGRQHDLLGFRDGPNLCVRVVPPLDPSTAAAPECVPQPLLARVGDPVAIIGGRVRQGIPAATVVYGLAADSVQSIDVLEQGDLLGTATVGNNAFVLAAPDRPRASDEPPDTNIVLRARGSDGLVDVRAPAFFSRRHSELRDLPGPVRADMTLQSGSVGWLKRREPRGEPFSWPYDSPDRVLYSRVLTPDPTSSFRLALAYGEDPDWQKNGRWYCVAWFWPLMPDSPNRGCGRVDAVSAGLMLEGTSPIVGNFTHYVGVAADEVRRVAIFYEDGSVQRVPVNDNVFSFYVATNQSSKLVAYDDAGQVVSLFVLR
jgi:hypothetical protein